MSLVPYTGMVNAALNLKRDKENLWVAIGKTTPWADEAAPPQEDVTAEELIETICYKKVDMTSLAVPDPNGDIEFELTKYRLIEDSLAEEEYARWCYVKASFSHLEENIGGIVLANASWRQTGLFTGLTAIEGYENETILQPDQVLSRGKLIFYDNHVRRTRDTSLRDVIEIIVAVTPPQPCQVGPTTTACLELCQYLCQTGCQTGVTCQTSCQTGITCQQPCQISCQTGCQMGVCQTSCELGTACQTACELGTNCQTACQTGSTCQVSCEVTCQNCQNVSCQACQGTCQNNCQLHITCQTSCESGCQTNCQTGCQNCQGVQCQTCQTTCQTSCQACQGIQCQTCQTACQLGSNCQTSCQIGCQDACQTGSCQAACQINCQNVGQSGITNNLDLYSTGVDNSRNVLADGANDPHYTWYTGPTGSGVLGDPSKVIYQPPFTPSPITVDIPGYGTCVNDYAVPLTGVFEIMGEQLRNIIDPHWSIYGPTGGPLNSNVVRQNFPGTWFPNNSSAAWGSVWDPAQTSDIIPHTAPAGSYQWVSQSLFIPYSTVTGEITIRWTASGVANSRILLNGVLLSGSAAGANPATLSSTITIAANQLSVGTNELRVQFDHPGGYLGCFIWMTSTVRSTDPASLISPTVWLDADPQISKWIPNDTNSKWVSYQMTIQPNMLQGQYVYKTTFTIPYAVYIARVRLRWTADNGYNSWINSNFTVPALAVSRIRLNGNILPNSAAGQAPALYGPGEFSYWSNEIVITSGFVSGLNELRFEFENVQNLNPNQPIDNPVAFRVQVLEAGAVDRATTTTTTTTTTTSTTTTTTSTSTTTTTTTSTSTTTTTTSSTTTTTTDTTTTTTTTTT